MALDHFLYHGEALDYEVADYNSTTLNERTVEIAVARSFLAGRPARYGLELGNVLAHYGVTGHRVVDRYEEADGVEALDVFDIEGRYRWIVAISTVEHVRHDEGERDPAGAGRAVQHLRSMLTPTGRLLVTVPIGYHPELDAEIRAGSLGADREALYVRGPENSWVPGDRRYDSPPYGLTTPWAEAVWVAEWSAP